MKPGKSTATTLTNHVLNFETSRLAMRRGHWLRVVVDGLLSFAGPFENMPTPESIQVPTGLLKKAADAIAHSMVRHREMRRAARRLAKMLLASEDERTKEHAEQDALMTRVIKLEAEIDRLEAARFPEPSKEVIMQDAAWARDFLGRVVARPNRGGSQKVSLVQELVQKLEALRTGRLARVEAGDLSHKAGNYAEQMKALLDDKTLGITVVLSSNGGTVGVASNVDPDSIVKGIVAWRDMVKLRKNAS